MNDSDGRILNEFDGKIRFAISSSYGDSEYNTHEYFDGLNDIPETKHIDRSIPSNNTWQLFMHIFDSKYVDKHLYRIYMRNGTILSYNDTHINMIYNMYQYPLISMNKYIMTKKECSISIMQHATCR